MNANDVRGRYNELRKDAIEAKAEGRFGGFESGADEVQIMLDALKAIRDGETPRQR